MIEEQTKIITDAMSVWGWHITALLFFVSSLGFLTAKKLEWFVGLIGVFVICEVIALNKKWKLEKGDKKDES